MAQDKKMAVVSIPSTPFYKFPDDSTSFQSYFEVAARLGDSDAQQELGFCYANGKGCKKDKKEAAKWYRAAVSRFSISLPLCTSFHEFCRRNRVQVLLAWLGSSKINTGDMVKSDQISDIVIRIFLGLYCGRTVERIICILSPRPMSVAAIVLDYPYPTLPKNRYPPSFVVAIPDLPSIHLFRRHLLTRSQ